jgi:hypothetical protein
VDQNLQHGWVRTTGIKCQNHQRPHFDQIELTRGYPKRGDDARRLVLPWKGYRLTTIVHPHFGADPVEVFAIDVSR